RTQETEACGYPERHLPSQMFCHERRQAGRGRASELSTHIHNSGNGTGRASADIGADRPECALREIKSACASGEHYARHPRIFHVSSESHEDSRHSGAGACSEATSNALAVLAGQTVADPTSKK